LRHWPLKPPFAVNLPDVLMVATAPLVPFQKVSAPACGKSTQRGFAPPERSSMLIPEFPPSDVNGSPPGGVAVPPAMTCPLTVSVLATGLLVLMPTPPA